MFKPGDAQRIDVATQFKDLPRDANWATVSILPNTGPDQFIAMAASYDDTGRYGAQTPFSDQLSAHWEGGKWQADDTHDSLITVGNGGRKDTRFQMTFHYVTEKGLADYVIEQKLAKDEQAFVDVGKLIRNQTPDAHGSVFPPAVTSGSYTLRDLDDHMGSIFEGKVITDKTFGDATYGCVECCGYNTGFSSSQNPIDLGVGIDDSPISVFAIDACTGSQVDITDYYDSWSTGNTAIATARYSLVHGVSVGTTTSYFQGNVPKYKTQPPCTDALRQVATPTNVKPEISGPNTVWWFSGQNPAGYATSITLTSSGGSGTTWNIVSGSNMVHLSTTSGSQTVVTSTGTAFSSSSTDIAITATANNQSSANFNITTRKPYLLAPGIITDSCDATYGYTDLIGYKIKDQMGIFMPSAIPVNENWESPVTNDYSGTNWRRINPQFQTTDPSNPAGFADEIQGENINLPAVPNTSCPGTAVAVQHWSQSWWIGTTTIGAGVRVQTDTLQKYENHAEHLVITSPAP